MVEAANPGAVTVELVDEDRVKRREMRDALHARALKCIQDRKSMPLLSEDTAKDEFVHQQVLEDGIMTLSQKIVTGISPK